MGGAKSARPARSSRGLAGLPGGRGGRGERLARALSNRLGPEWVQALRRAGALGRARGERVCLVGGSVRDLLLGRGSRDLDLVVEGDAAGLARALAGLLGGRHRVHAAFGTASVELPDGARLDLATARRERYAGPAALPRVEAAGLHADLLRRDFTINCLALDLTPGRFGELIDPCGGGEDLRAGQIRVLHEQSFVDDPTRVFRALRLAARLSFRPAPGTARLIRDAVRGGMIERISPARLRREVAAALQEEEAPAAAAALQRFGVWQRIDPALRCGTLERGRLARLQRFPRGLAGPRWVAGLALIAFDRTSRQRRRLVERLRPDRRSGTRLLEGPAQARAILRALSAARGLRPGAVWTACRRRSELAVALAWAVTRSGRLRRKLERYAGEWAGARADIDGTDLLRAGIPQGPAVARGLEAALRAKLEGRAGDREAQLRQALRAARRRRGSSPA